MEIKNKTILAGTGIGRWSIFMVLVLLASFIPFRKINSAGIGSLVITTNPPLDAVAYIDGLSPVIITNGKSGSVPVNEGLHYIVFEEDADGYIDGYIGPEPDLNTSNDDPSNLDPSPSDADQGRRIYISAGATTTMAVDFFKPSNLKSIKRTTAESLFFDPSAPGVTTTDSRLQLKKGVASISVDGENWQRSAAEVLVLGDIPPLISIEKTDGKSFVSPGERLNYTIRFNVLGGSGGINYTALVLDQIDTDKMGIDFFTDYEFCDPVCRSISPFVSGGDIAFDLNASYSLFKGEEYIIKINDIRVLESAIESDKIVNVASISLGGGEIATDTDTDIIANAFAQEDFGGDIYAKGDLGMGVAPGGVYNAQYILAADGSVSATSARDLVIEDYEIRPGSGSDLGAGSCIDGSACKVMNDNISRMIQGGTKKNNNINGFIDFSDDAPEGDAWIYDGGLTIGGASGVRVSGKGTIIVNGGDLNINDNIFYNDTESIIGFIVIGGSVNISGDVTGVNGIFYIPDGNYNTGENPGASLFNNGVFVAKGFDLQRTFVGKKTYDVAASGIDPEDSEALNGYCSAVLPENPSPVGVCSEKITVPGSQDICTILECLDIKEPSETFRYDSRILFSPPPGFGGRFLRSLN